jgi:hypothetical protein
MGHNVDHSTPPSAKVKNGQSYTSASLICLHGVYRDNFTLCFVINTQFIPLRKNQNKPSKEHKTKNVRA